MTQQTDLDSHHIEGFTRGGARLSVPLISEIKENLWVGGCVPHVKLPLDFKYVVSLYPWGQYDLPPGCSRVEVQMYDSAEMPDETLLYGLAQLVGLFQQTGKTLVHCQAGLNRSNLVTALMLSEVEGMKPHEAIELLREKRCSECLCNTTFEHWLRART